MLSPAWAQRNPSSAGDLDMNTHRADPRAGPVDSQCGYSRMGGTDPSEGVDNEVCTPAVEAHSWPSTCPWSVAEMNHHLESGKLGEDTSAQDYTQNVHGRKGVTSLGTQVIRQLPQPH